MNGRASEQATSGALRGSGAARAPGQLVEAADSRAGTVSPRCSRAQGVPRRAASSSPRGRVGALGGAWRVRDSRVLRRGGHRERFGVLACRLRALGGAAGLGEALWRSAVRPPGVGPVLGPFRPRAAHVLRLAGPLQLLATCPARLKLLPLRVCSSLSHLCPATWHPVLSTKRQSGCPSAFPAARGKL